MGQRIAAIAWTAGTVALAGLSAAASSAAPVTTWSVSRTWSVSPGGAVTLTPSGHVTLTDISTRNSLVCAHSKGAGRFKSGSGLPGAGIGSVTALSVTSCTGPSGLTVTMTSGDLPWTLNAKSYDPAITSGLTTGTISGIHATLAGTRCRATVDGTGASAGDGTTQIHFHNSLDKLKIRSQDSSLHFYDVSGCGGLINSGDAVTLSSAYKVTPAQTITGS